jgi:hypothetical protein
LIPHHPPKGKPNAFFLASWRLYWTILAPAFLSFTLAECGLGFARILRFVGGKYRWKNKNWLT